MKTLFYHFVSFVAVVIGCVLIGCFMLGCYELYLFNKWFILFLPLSVAIFVRCVGYLKSHIIQPQSVFSDRKKRDEKNSKLLKKLISNTHNN